MTALWLLGLVLPAGYWLTWGGQFENLSAARKRLAIVVPLSLLLIASLVANWSHDAVRTPLLVALGSHAAMRIWSGLDFIPKALAFERADPATITEAAARHWTRRSPSRALLDVVTCGAMMTALMSAARLS